MTAKQAADIEIKKSLRQEHKEFIEYIEELNPIMDALVLEWEAEQAKVPQYSHCGLAYSKPIDK